MRNSEIQCNSIVDVRLFGSAARGDFDKLSDIDILVVSNEGKPDTKSLELALENRFNMALDISIYSINRLQSMFSEGHLFSWHLYKESCHLKYEKTIDSIALLGTPTPYKSASNDASELLDLLEAIRNELKSSSSLTFEAGLLYVCTRNIALSASWHAGNGIKFGRNSPFEIAVGKLPFPLSRADYDILVACRHASTRGKTTGVPSRSWLEDQASLCYQWAFEVKEWIVECENVN